MKKLSLFLALCVLMFAGAGCAGKMVFTKDNKIFQIKDDGTGSAPIQASAPLPTPPPESDIYRFPDVNHDGSRVAFIVKHPASDSGSLWSMKLDGGDLRCIMNGINASMPKWYPDQQKIAYFGGLMGICSVSTNLGLATGTTLCSTGVYDRGGFDISKPVAGQLQIIFSRYETSNNFYKLYRLILGSCIEIDDIGSYPNQFGVGVTANDVIETLPAVSIAQDIVVNAVKWGSGKIGIRMRSINDNGSVGIPFTMKLDVPGVSIDLIDGLALAGDSNAIYFSAKAAGSSYSEIYKISVKEYIAILRAIISSPSTLPPIETVTPTKLTTGVWPSGIKEQP
jgi:hypothetical protein